jgi:RNA recognition motif-containing protein
MTEDSLTELFEQYGEVEKTVIIKDRETNRPKGFGFVTMNNDEEARSAIEALNEKDIEGRVLRVNEAKPREERPRRSF